MQDEFGGRRRSREGLRRRSRRVVDFPLLLLETEDGEPFEETLLDFVEAVVVFVELGTSGVDEVAGEREGSRVVPGESEEPVEVVACGGRPVSEMAVRRRVTLTHE